MAANNTPIPDLIELSGIGVNTTYDTDPSGGGQMLGVVDNALYTDGDSSNSSTQIAELNETNSGNGGILTIDGTDYAFELIEPSGNVTVTLGNGFTGVTQDMVFIQATPTGGGSARYFALFDDNLGDLGGIQSIRTSTLDFDPAGNDTMINADEDNDIRAVCFCAGTRIATPAGARAVECIEAGDPVLTMDHGIRPVIWTGGMYVLAEEMRGQPKLRPIRIEKDALAPGQPHAALMVSAQHRILLRSIVAERMFGASETLIPAVKLLGLPGVNWMDPVDTHYVHLLLNTHEILFANGTPAESLFVAEQTRCAMRCDLSFRIAARGADRTAARRIVERRGDVDELLRRIAKNEKLALQPAT